MKGNNKYIKLKYSNLFMIIVSIILLLYYFILGNLSLDWKYTQGKIIEKDYTYKSGQYYRVDYDGSLKSDGYEIFFNDITYSYIVNGIEYRSNRVSYPNINFPIEFRKTTGVYYCEKYPSFSVLEPEFHFSFFIVIWFFTLFISFIHFLNKEKNLK
jgi:hypothetical protein